MGVRNRRKNECSVDNHTDDNTDNAELKQDEGENSKSGPTRNTFPSCSYSFKLSVIINAILVTLIAAIVPQLLVSSAVKQFQKQTAPPQLPNTIKNAPINNRLPNYTQSQWSPNQQGCDIRSEVTLSALDRAKTAECKQLIMDTACAIHNNVFTDKYIQSECPATEPSARLKYEGCYVDSAQDQLLLGVRYVSNNETTPEWCVDHCYNGGYQLAGLYRGHECQCGHMNTLQRKTEDEKCKEHTCTGDHKQFCGGLYTVAVYNTGFGKQLLHPFPREGSLYNSTFTSKEPDIKILFLILLNGRDTRQVRRMFKQIYRPEHYYYIHVDSNQPFMQRDMLNLEQIMGQHYSNVFVTKKQQHAIWAGSRFLTITLDAFRDIKYVLGWDWELMINLSESDMMITSFEELQTTLKTHRGYSYLGTNTGPSREFFTKQGLDKAFVECEKRSFIVGNRERLPKGIYFNGGSNWFMIDRSLADYSISISPTATALRKYYEHTVFTVESFFHTLLLNSPMCEKLWNTHLRFAIFEMHRGCSCEEKRSAIDWCGCSPQTLRMKYWKKISKIPENLRRDRYFVRKVESIIDNRVIAMIEQEAKGSPSVYESEISYPKVWVNDYDHSIDAVNSKHDAKRLWMRSIARLALKELNVDNKCVVHGLGTLTIHRHKHAPNYWLLVRATIKCAHNLLDVEILTRRMVMQLLDREEGDSNQYKVKGQIVTLRRIDVGTKWDPREEVFRNYAGIITTDDQPVLRHEWHLDIMDEDHFDEVVEAEQKFSFEGSVVWKSETGTIVSSYPVDVSYPMEDINLDRMILAAGSKLKTEQSNYKLNPGIWTSQLYLGEDQVADISFPVYPTFEGTNGKLRPVIDSLTEEFYPIVATCIVNDSKDSHLAPKLSICSDMPWSSLTPDPKSEIKTGNYKEWFDFVPTERQVQPPE